MLGRERTPFGIHQQAPLGDADERIVRLIILRVREERLVGCHKRDALRVSKLQEAGLDRPLARGAVTLQLDIEPIAKQMRQGGATIVRQVCLSRDEGHIERSTGPAA